MDNNHQKPRTSKIGNGRIVDSVEGTFSIENIYKIRPKKRNQMQRFSACGYIFEMLSCISGFYRHLFQTFQNCIKTIPSITIVAAVGQ